MDPLTNLNLDEAVRVLFDIEEIKKLQARYFRLLDQKDWTGFAELFTENVSYDYPTFSDRQGRENLLAEVAAFAGNGISVHHGHMPEIEILSPTRAKGVWALAYEIESVDDSGERIDLRGFARYFEEFERNAGVWRISSIRLV